VFALGFQRLKEQLGERMGEALECEHGSADGAEVVQRTTTGVAYLRRQSNMPGFTNGSEHWALTADGLVYWAGAAADPPADAVRVAPSNVGVLPEQRIVAYYGNPLASVLGVLGEPPPEQMLEWLLGQAEAYAALDPSRPVQPALELIAVLAQAGAGQDGLYRARTAPEVIEQVAEWAERCGCLLILDVQPGRGSVAEEVAWLLPYLKRPNVHLALDPEFAMRTDQEPGRAIGTLDAAEVNDVISLLADVVETERIPPKVLIVHRFLESMLTGYQDIQLDPRVQVVVDMDGFGSPEAKTSKYRDLVRDQPVQFAGMKLFYRYDAPLLSPEDVLELEPAPDVVIYQ
jgi:hypothetical protein